MKKENKEQKPVADFRDEYPKFTKEMKHTHKILVPDMLPVHFGIIVEILKKDGWDFELLHNDSRAVIDEGLKTSITIPAIPRCALRGSLSTRSKAENTTWSTRRS